MQVLHVCSEIFPLLKTGGLADVVGALPAAQIADGTDTRVLLPAFPDLKKGFRIRRSWRRCRRLQGTLICCLVSSMAWVFT